MVGAIATKLLPPSSDRYRRTPPKKIVLGLVGCTEICRSYQQCVPHDAVAAGIWVQVRPASVVVQMPSNMLVVLFCTAANRRLVEVGVIAMLMRPTAAVGKPLPSAC